MPTTVAVYDTKPYDRESLGSANGAEANNWRFLDFRLSPILLKPPPAPRLSAFSTMIGWTAPVWRRWPPRACGLWPCMHWVQ